MKALRQKLATESGGAARKAAMSARRVNPLADKLEAVLAADAFDAAAIQWASHRSRYADGVRFLLARATDRAENYSNIVQAILDCHSPFAPFRIAAGFRALAVNNADRANGLFTIDDLRGLGTERARAALAALGEIADWHAAPRKIRAAFALGVLVRAFRDGAGR